MVDVLDARGGGALAITHVGGGACTLARYVAATRPGSTQIVLEPDAELIRFVRARLPLPKGIRIRIRPVGGREGIAALADASADVVVLDAYVGGRVPAELTTAQFLADVARVLRADGLLLANLTDGPPLDYTRRAVAAARTVLPHALLIGSTGVLGRRRIGNIVLAASRGELPTGEIRRAAASAMFPTRVMAGRALSEFVGTFRPLTDTDSMRSPRPPEEGWRVSAR
jgi:spermidine synthase